MSMTQDVNSLVANSDQLGSLPSIFYQINEAVEDPECSFSDIGDIISKDSALCARLLKIVNSSFFGFSSKVETITHAITIVGMTQLRDLALATVIVNNFDGLPKNAINMKSFWRHSICVGLAGRVIGIYLKKSNPERFYVLGLLHDLGRLLLYLTIPEDMSRVLELSENGGLMHEAESQVLGCDHAEVGGALLKHWNLPEKMVEAVKYHHNPSSAPYFPLEAAVIHMADIVVQTMELGSSGEKYVPDIDSKAWDKLRLPANMLSSVITQVSLQVDDMDEIFG